MNSSFSNLFGNPTYDNQSNTNNISSSGSLFGNNNNNFGSLISINLNDKKKIESCDCLSLKNDEKIIKNENEKRKGINSLFGALINDEKNKQ